MRTVSTEWKKAFGCYNDGGGRVTLTPVNGLRIKFSVDGDQTDVTTPTVTGNHYSAESVLTDICNGIEKNYQKNYATLDLNRWGLDGEVNAIESGYAKGYICNYLTNDSCQFNADRNPSIMLTFDEAVTDIPGITIQWCTAFNEFARDFSVRYRNGATTVKTATVTDNTKVISHIVGSAQNFDSIQIIVTKWCLPHARARIEDVNLGLKFDLSGTDLLSFSHIQSGDRCSFKLPQNYVKFSIFNEGDIWNPDNPNGVYQYLTNRTMVKVYYGVKVNNAMEWVLANTSIMKTCAVNGINANFETQSWLDLMTAKFDTTHSAVSDAEDMVLSIFDQTGFDYDPLGNAIYSYNSQVLSHISVSIPDGFNYTLSGALQLLCNMGRQIMFIGSDGVVNIQTEGTTATDYYIDDYVAYSDISLSENSGISGVVINNRGTYYPTGSEDLGVLQKITNPLIPQSGSVGANVASGVVNTIGKGNAKKSFSCSDFHADPRLEIYDRVTVKTKYSENNVAVDTLKITFNGAFHGSFSGRVVANN